MNFQEFLPILSGFFIGSLLYFVPKAYRVVIGLFLIFAFGFIAAISSGEWQISPAFLLIDISLVAVSSLAGFGAVHYLSSFLRKTA